jgi:hypothetical protein
MTTIVLRVKGDNHTFGSLHEATMRARVVYGTLVEIKRRVDLQMLDGLIDLGHWLNALRESQPEPMWRRHGADGWRAHISRYAIHYKTAQRAMKLAAWDQEGRPDRSDGTRVPSQVGVSPDGTRVPSATTIRGALSLAGVPVEAPDEDPIDHELLAEYVAEEHGPLDASVPVPWEDEPMTLNTPLQGGAEQARPLTLSDTPEARGQGVPSSAPQAHDPDISGVTTSGRHLSPPNAVPALAAGTAALSKGASGEQLSMATLYRTAIDKMERDAREILGGTGSRFWSEFQEFKRRVLAQEAAA